MDAHNTVAVKIDDLKRSVEGEMDNIQTHVRDQKDKMAELCKKVEMMVENGPSAF